MMRHADPIEELTGLRALARSLVQGDADADAEDLLQDAAVAALEHPPSLDRPVRPWLATVIVNRWRMNRRSASRRRAREAAIEVPVRDDIDPGERAEMLRRLGEAVAALAEPYRDTVIARYFDGKTSIEIAREQGIPAVTVRTRLSRALEQLRARLDEHAPRKKWQRVLVPVPVRWSWFAKAKAVHALVALLVAFVLGAALYAWRATSQDTPVALETRALRRASAHAAPAAAAPVRLDDVRLAGGAAAGRVLDATTGQGVPGAELTFTGPRGALAVRGGDDGAFELAPASPGDYVLAQVSAPGYLAYAPDVKMSGVHLALAAGRAVRGVTVYVVPATEISARVVDELGHGVAGAHVAVVGDPMIDPADAAWTSDRDGRFAFHAAEGAVLEAVAGDRLGWARIDLRAEQTRELRIDVAKLPPRDQVIAGRVIDEHGAPVADVLVRAYPEKEMEMKSGVQVHAPAFATSDASGAFELHGLDRRPYMVAAEADGRATAIVKHVASGTRDVSLAVTTGERLEGTVATAGGEPVPAFVLNVFRCDGSARDLLVSRTFVEPDGKFSLPVAPGRYQVEAAAAGWAQADVLASPGDAVRLVLARGATLRGKVVSEADGTPIARARVIRENAASNHAEPELGAISGDDGTFELAGIPPGPFTVAISAARFHTRIEWRIADADRVAPIVTALAPLAAGAEPRTDYVGIGITSTPDGDDILVESVTPGGGAEAAGLVVGDHIVTVDGLSVRDLGEPATVAHIRGLPGTSVTLGLRRDDRVVTLAVTRSQVQS